MTVPACRVSILQHNSVALPLISPHGWKLIVFCAKPLLGGGFFQSTFQVVICSKAPLSGSLAGFFNFCTCYKLGKF